MEIAVIFELTKCQVPQIVTFWYLKSIFYVKNCLYLFKKKFTPVFLTDEQLLQKACFTNFKFGGMYFFFWNHAQILLPQAMSIHKIQQFPWRPFIFFW